MARCIEAHINKEGNKKFCLGDGQCLQQMDPHTYEKSADIICSNDCQLVKCPNYVICNSKLPQWVLNCCHGLCQNCDIIFGTWKGSKGILHIQENKECCICLDIKQSIELPNCDHTLCIDCMKLYYFPINPDDVMNLPYLAKCPLCRK